MKPNRSIGDKRVKPTRAQTSAVDQTTEFDHVGHNELHFSNLLPKLRGPNSSAGLIAAPELAHAAGKLRNGNMCGPRKSQRNAPASKAGPLQVVDCQPSQTNYHRQHDAKGKPLHRTGVADTPP
jgi:hypothetical protein